jgi:hypothetical protein
MVDIHGGDTIHHRQGFDAGQLRLFLVAGEKVASVPLADGPCRVRRGMCADMLVVRVDTFRAKIWNADASNSSLYVELLG